MPQVSASCVKPTPSQYGAATIGGSSWSVRGSMHLMPAKIEPKHFEAAPLLAPGARVLCESQAVAVEDICLVQIWHLQQHG